MIAWHDEIEQRIERKLQLLRGRILRWRGAKVGWHFGLGRGVQLRYPGCFTAGDNVLIDNYAFLHCLSQRGVKIGSSTSIDPNLWLHCGGTPVGYQHGYFEIGEHSFIGCNAVMGAGGGIRIGNHVLIGQSVNIHAENHQFADADKRIDEQGVSYKGIVIEDDVWIGSKVTILDGVTIGQGAVVGAGAVVTAAVPAYAIAVGVPARVIAARGAQTVSSADLQI